MLCHGRIDRVAAWFLRQRFGGKENSRPRTGRMWGLYRRLQPRISLLSLGHRLAGWGVWRILRCGSFGLRRRGIRSDRLRTFLDSGFRRRRGIPRWEYVFRIDRGQVRARGNRN
jgi:hypothetical protein